MKVRNKLVFIAGPTGVGKTELSLKIAEKIDAEIISMDSMQVYKGMNIGTAKVGTRERALVKHHLIDIVEPNERFTVSDYQDKAYTTIKEIEKKGHNILFVGGTGLYMDAVIRNYHFAETDYNESLRKELEQAYHSNGGQELYSYLKKIDSQTASQLTLSDKKKIIRAIEVYKNTGRSLSEHKKSDEEGPLFDSLIFILYRDREDLYARINDRVDNMFKDGLIEENKKLQYALHSGAGQALQAIGYREIQYYLRGIMTEGEARNLLKKNSRNYAKRQLTWFKKTPQAIWIRADASPSSIFDEMMQKIELFLESR